MKKTLLSLCLIFGIAFFISASLFAQDAFDDCFEIERLKAKSDGLGAVESAEQASKVCSLKFGDVKKRDDADSLTTPKETRFFVSLSPFHNAKVTLINNYSYEYYRSGPGYSSLRFGSGKSESEEKLDRGLGLNLGYNFSKWRVSYNYYTWEIENTKINNNLVFADYVITNEKLKFYAGVGIGKGTIEDKNSSVSKSGDSIGFKLGLDYFINKNFHLGFGWLESNFKYKIDNSYSNEFTTVIDENNISITVSSYFLNLTTHF